MDEREALIAKITEEATKKAKSDKLNAAQTKLYVEEEVKKAVEEYDKKTKETRATSTQVQAIPTATTANNDSIVSEKDTKEEVKKTTSKKYIVHTPVKNFCGEVAGVQFAYGKAEVKPGWILNWFKEHGYEVEEVSN